MRLPGQRSESGRAFTQDPLQSLVAAGRRVARDDRTGGSDRAADDGFATRDDRNARSHGATGGVGACFEVLVVGGGVSGCACAAVLADQNTKVTVVSSALDSIGLPGYGPDVSAGSDRAAIAEVLGAIPPPLRGVWLSAATTPDCESGLFAVDRRMVSIETKRALEQIPLLEFRQGLVTDLRIVDDASVPGGWCDVASRRVAVETVFGEVMEADAVVIAVGLGLGGRVYVGEDVMPGGRYGETGADGLLRALECMGANLEEVRLEVGPRFGGSWPAGVDRRGDYPCGDEVSGRVAEVFRDADGNPVDADELAGSLVRALPLRGVLKATASLGCVTGGGWPTEYPAAPHWTDGLRTKTMVVMGSSARGPAPLISPDGAATGEVHVDPVASGGYDATGRTSGREGGERESAIASRLGHRVIGQRISSISEFGRLTLTTTPLLPVWVAGRAGGAGEYVQSLRSGVRVARDVRAWLEGARE
ncbi:MAG: FAD-dependent oxidoreductase [Thermoleophilia bacterium]|nr:FAD-dependent oxidoreductase [Thermoleophilia bacterium]